MARLTISCLCQFMSVVLLCRSSVCTCLLPWYLWRALPDFHQTLTTVASLNSLGFGLRRSKVTKAKSTICGVSMHKLWYFSRHTCLFCWFSVVLLTDTLPSRPRPLPPTAFIGRAKYKAKSTRHNCLKVSGSQILWRKLRITITGSVFITVLTYGRLYEPNQLNPKSSQEPHLHVVS